MNGLNVRIYSYHAVENVTDDTIDIFVDVGGDTFSGQIYTLDNVKRRLNDGELPNSFYDLSDVVVQRLTVQSIEYIVRPLINENELSMIFCKQQP